MSISYERPTDRVLASSNLNYQLLASKEFKVLNLYPYWSVIA